MKNIFKDLITITAFAEAQKRVISTLKNIDRQQKQQKKPN